MRIMMMVSFLVLVALGTLGCQPTFEDGGCVMDSDCFSDEYCAPVRVCVLRTSNSLVISSFTPSEPIVGQGEGVTLSWKTRGGKSARIDGPDGFTYEIPSASVTEGEFELTELETTGRLTYTLTLEWEDLEKTEDLEIEVKPREVIIPIIDRFESDVETIDPGARVTLSWTLSDAASAVITGGEVPFDIPEAQLGSGRVDVNPTETTTYVLTASNGDERAEASRVITVIPPPEPGITSFRASDTSIIVGESVTLSWNVTDGTSLSILDTDSAEVFGSQDLAVVEAGSVMLSPTQDTTYTLNVLNAVGSTQSMPLDVMVTVAPTITSFTASQTMNVTPGSMVDLSWDVTGADSIEIRDQDNMLITSSMMATGTFAATIAANTTFTLTASNAAGDATSMTTVTILGSPAITSFTASKQVDLTFNESIDLSWEVVDADSIEIRDQDNALITSSMMATGTFAVNVDANTTYTLTASNPTGDVTADIVVTLLTPPTITSFTASQTMNVTPGSMVDLSWDVTGADSIEIRDQDNMLITSSMMATGTFAATIAANTTFTLTASNAAGSLSAAVTVNALAPPIIDAFMADVTTTVSGDAVTLSWMTQDTTSLTITDDQGGASVMVMAGDIPSGTLLVRPQVSTVYTLTAQSAGVGNFVTQDVTITVNAAPLLITEVLFAPTTPLADRQWVEIYNAGTTFVELEHYSLGWGGASFAANTKAFMPYTLAPRETYVVGLVSDAANFSPVIDLASAFSPLLGPGTGAADGVALFFLEAPDVMASSVPIDSVLWGGANTSLLPDEAGGADTEISPVPVGTSIVRVSGASDLMVDSGLGHPNLPIFVDAITPLSGPNTATNTFMIEGYGFDPVLDTFTLGTTPLSCTGDSETLMCQLDLMMPSSDVGLVALSIARTQMYVKDAQGEPMLAPAGVVYTHVQQDVFFFTALELDPGADFECGTLAPTTSTAAAGSPIVVDVRLYAVGSTEGAMGMLPAGWVLQAAFFDAGTAPFETFSPVWQTWMSGTDGQIDDFMDSDNEIFSLSLSSATARSAQAAFRVSRDMGSTWIYCNAEAQGGSGLGWVQGVDVTWN